MTLRIQQWTGLVKGFRGRAAFSQLPLVSNKPGYEIGIRINMGVLNALLLFDALVKLHKVRLDTVLSLLRLRQAATLTE